ncbi:MAG: FHA domain-containing protein [Azonexus sp.]|jgi:pSer/pThr/pTyr-binding forkhead associated (FHA) protein|nr:FHA domain-containing protein [Azonexus sp.]
MAKLILSMDGLVLKEIVLNKERLTIGRKPQNEIQIDNMAISGEHAVIVTIRGDSFLEDLDSTNGTLVNGQPVKKHILRNNDIVELGKYRLKFLTSGSEVEGDGEKTGQNRQALAKLASEMELVPTNDALTRTHTGVSTAPPSPSALPTAAVQLLNGPHVGKEMVLTKTLTTLGKPGQQTAVISRRPNGYFITHVEGEKSPLLNGRVIDVQAYPLNDHDIIEIAGIKMEFFFKS